jgi:hypothetical protein
MSNEEVLRRITALIEITRNTGMVTRRVQGRILSSLPDEQLKEIAQDLAKIYRAVPTSYAALRGENVNGPDPRR